MDKTILICKEREYTGRLGLAEHLGDTKKLRRLALTMLILCRMQSRHAHCLAQAKWEEIQALRRSMKKLEADGVQIPLGKLRIRKLEQEKDKAEQELSRVGELICNTLEIWQRSGASFEDLCNLCNRDPEQVRKMLLGDTRIDESFANLATVYNLDYKNPRDTGWLEDSVDAPLTHALKAFLLDTMLHTEAGQKASSEALSAIFPELMEKALTAYTDADGALARLEDKDGNVVWSSGQEEGGDFK